MKHLASGTLIILLAACGVDGDPLPPENIAETPPDSAISRSE